MKHPIILPRSSRFTRLVILQVHVQWFCSSGERTLAQFHQYYWAPSSRAAVRSALYHCMKCRLRNAQPQIPLMAALPPARVESLQPAFSITGIDFFGPLLVVIHRRQHKRYGCLFTCMSTRAVHLEVCHSLDVSSFLMAFRRFISRRGCPHTCFSDNGTNFLAGERELREAVARLDKEENQNFMTSRQITWRFSPPSGPHFGHPDPISADLGRS